MAHQGINGSSRAQNTQHGDGVWRHFGMTCIDHNMRKTAPWNHPSKFMEARFIVNTENNDIVWYSSTWPTGKER